MNEIKEKVKENYSKIVKEEEDSCCGPGCCGGNKSGSNEFSDDYSQQDGYFPDADYGLGCGIPTSGAEIKEGDIVLDLGSGAGNDVFVARSLVGEKGRVIGVDFTQDMIDKANQNKSKLGFTNVNFVLGEIEALPFQNESVTVVISNCVLNLVPDKRKAFSEIHRVLKDDGHFSISDVVLSGELNERMRAIAELYVGWSAGALKKENYLNIVEETGFKNIEVTKEKVINLPDDFLLQYLTAEELSDYHNSGVKVLSITLKATK